MSFERNNLAARGLLLYVAVCLGGGALLGATLPLVLYLPTVVSDWSANPQYTHPAVSAVMYGATGIVLGTLFALGCLTLNLFLKLGERGILRTPRAWITFCRCALVGAAAGISSYALIFWTEEFGEFIGVGVAVVAALGLFASELLVRRASVEDPSSARRTDAPK
jgi:hypothetical protein